MSKIEHFLDYFIPHNYDLSLEIDPGQTSFSGQVRISGRAQTTNIKLHAEDLLIQAVSVNQRAVAFIHEQACLSFSVADQNSRDLLISITFSGRINNSMTGIYVSNYQWQNQTNQLISTQFESHYARQAFPCVDEPAAKASFSLTITTTADLTVLANTSICQRQLKRNRQIVKFNPTPKMSPYLLAFVIGDLISKTRLSESGVKTTVYATPAQSPTSLNFALDIASRAIDWYETYLRVPYPLDKCDHVAIPDFAAGAMENWGLVTYREACLLADDTTTITTKEYIASVITHELAHMWFGNLVTMQWWDELWLNESLASLMEYRCLDSIEASFNCWEVFYAQSLNSARQRDSLPGVQAILTPIKHPDEISTIFDGAIVYSKGAVVMKMLENLVGPNAFRKALSHYLNKFAYQTASTQDFLRSFRNFSKFKVDDFLLTWLKKPGYPLVTISKSNSGFQLEQQQFAYSSDTCWSIPLITTSTRLWDTKTTQTKELISDLDRQSLSVVRYQNDLIDQATEQIVQKQDPITSYCFLGSQILLARQRLLPIESLVKLMEGFQDNTSYLVWLAISQIIKNLQLFVDPSDKSEQDLNQLIAKLITPHLKNLGWSTKTSDDINQLKLRPLIVTLALTSHQTALLEPAQQILADFKVEDFENLPSNLREHLIGVKVRSSNELKLLEQLFRQYAQTSNPDFKDDLLSGLSYSEDQECVQYLLDRLLDSQFVKPQDILTWFASIIANPRNRPLAWHWLKQHFYQLVELFSKNKDYVDFIRLSASYLLSPKELRDFQIFFKPYLKNRAAQRTIKVGKQDIKNRQRLYLANYRTVRQAIQKALESDLH